jgi:hypothetical protein
VIRARSVEVADLVFPEHALDRMSSRHITEVEVYDVVEDADTIIERDDGRTEYIRLVDDRREIMVVIEGDGETVVSIMSRTVRRPRTR